MRTRICCLLLPALLPWVAAGQGGLTPSALRCEYRTDPLGVTASPPRLSWIVASTRAGLRSQRQTAYQILVASSREKLDAGQGDLWNSSKVASSETAHVLYAGSPLGSSQEYWWKVRVWDEHGQVSAWSRPARWQMGLLAPDEWKAKWIETADPVMADHNGYLSRLERNPDARKWIVIDLLKTEEIERVRLYPAKPFDIEPEKPGYLFPVRFLVDVSESADFARFETVVDRTAEDYPNPGVKPAEFQFAPRRARYVRLTVTRVAGDGGGNYGFALAEVEVLGKARPLPLPLSHGARVTASDSTEKGAWSAANLIDAVTVSMRGRSGPPAPASMLRTSFRLSDQVARAHVYVSALGLYELRINGKRVGENVLAPEWTDYNTRVQYQTFDVTPVLQRGENAIGVLAGEGWYAGRISFLPGRRHYGVRPRVIVQLEIEMKNGTRQTILSDERWKGTTDGPVRRADIFDGEVYDARKEMPGWDTPAFDDSAWKPARIFEDFKATLTSQYDEPIQVTVELKPVAIREPSPGVYVLDMGQNMVGWVRARLRGERGREVTLRHGEVLEPDGNIYTDNLRQNLFGADAKEVYILRGAGAEEVFEPHFTFHGFRYVEVTGLAAKPSLAMFTGRVLHTAATRTGTFESSSPMLNKLMTNIWWTQIGNLTGIPTDCPQRSERAGWMADAQIISQTAMFNLNMAPFYTKWFQDIRDAQGAGGAYTAFAPSSVGRAGDGGNPPGWSDAGVIIPWNVYVNYGDKRILEQHFESAARYVESLRAANPDLIWRKGKSRGVEFGDWLNGDSLDIKDWPKEGAATPMDILATAFFAHSTELLSKMAAALGRGEEAERYSSLAARIKSAFQREFVQPDGRITGKGYPDPFFTTGAGVPVNGDNQTTYALALHFGLLPEALRERAVEHMMGRLQEYNGYLSTGIHGTYRLMLELSNAGHTETAYRLLANRNVPSWGYMLDHGATTVWERWDGYVEGRGYQTPYMNSFNHCALGAVGEWVYRNVAGINPDSRNPGYRHFIIHPRPGGGLTFTRARYDSIRGPIVSEWKIADGSITMRVTVPPNTTATIYVPTRLADAVREGDKPAKEAPGVNLLPVEKGFAVFGVGSGEYAFTAPE